MILQHETFSEMKVKEDLTEKGDGKGSHFTIFLLLFYSTGLYMRFTFHNQRTIPLFFIKIQAKNII